MVTISMLEVIPKITSLKHLPVYHSQWLSFWSMISI